MIVCPACGHQSPDGSAHCTQCGETLDSTGPGHPKTRNFGDQDVKNLVARIERETAQEEGEGNLLAGLPRPKVGSMVSPLRGGQTAASRVPDKRARSASGSTVMGMPIYTTGEHGLVRPTPAAAPPTVTAKPQTGPASIDTLASIQSLDSFQDDFTGASQPPAGVAPPPGADLAADGRPDGSHSPGSAEPHDPSDDRRSTPASPVPAVDDPPPMGDDPPGLGAVEPELGAALPPLSAPPEDAVPSLPGRATFNESGPPQGGRQGSDGRTIALLIAVVIGIGALAFALFR